MMQVGASGHAGGVAITGMSCLFPGAPDVDAYWRNILDKVDATSDPPPESWDPDVYYDPDFADTDATYCKRGGYLGSLATFDPLAHGVPPVSVGGEPDQWLALRLAQAALEDAGSATLPRHVRERTAIVVGKGTYLNGGNAIAVQRGLVIGQTLDLIRRLYPEHSDDDIEELREEMQRVLPPLGPETVPGLIPNIVVGRIANRLDFMGPAYTVDAACASSLVAVQLAVRDLLSGECDLALAGGSQVWMPVPTLNLFCRLGALSRREQIRPFDREADGTLLGEGIGMVVLKRLADAERNGDRIYAVIRGVGVSSDGRAVGVMAPRVEGEELALRRSYAEAGISPRTVGLIEAHGTGTPVGDVVEIDALTRVFGERDGELPRCGLGTVKSMISHTIPAAGVAGLIKVALALHHRVLPPTLHCDEPNPKLERTPFYVNTETRPWIHAGSEPRRAGINAFGFGGINAHAVLEEFDGGSAADHRPPWETEVCILESESQDGLLAEAERLASALASAPPFGLTDLAFTLGRALGRAERPLRLAIVASSLDDLRQKLGQAIEKLRSRDCRRIKAVSGIYYAAEPLGRKGDVVFVFPGEGAQYPNMLADLCVCFPEVREVFDRIDRLYAGHPRGYLLSDWVFPRPAFSEEERRRAEERLMQLDIAVESVLTANGAVHALLRRLVGEPDAMVGHSTGEHSAAIASGVLDLDTDERLRAFCEGLHNSYADAASRQDIPRAVLIALGAGGTQALEMASEAGGEIHLAMDNCPHQAVLVGEPAAAARVRQIAAREGIVAEELPYDRAVHTPLFAPFADNLRGIFAALPVRAARTQLWSCTTAGPYPDDPAAIRELLVEHWTSPVRFGETIEALYERGARMFVEVGPRGNMTAFIEDVLRGRPCCAVASDVRRRSGVTQLNHLVGLLAVHGIDVDIGHLFEERRADEIDWRDPAAEQGAGGGVEVSLSTAWPMLRLPPEVSERLRSRGVRSGNGQEPAPEPAPPPVTAAEGAPALPAVAQSAEPVLARSAVLHGAPLAGDDDDEAAAVMDDHLRTMEQFLDAGEQIMRAYLGGAAPVVVEGTRHPLLGTIVASQPGLELVARRVVDPAEDRYLLAHTLGRAVSRTDPDLHALALMPLAMSLEILAEAAAALVVEGSVVGLRDVRAHRWLAWGEEPRTLEVHARLLASKDGCARVHVELAELADGAAAGAPAVEADVLLHDRFPAPPPAVAADLREGRPSRFEPGVLYDEVMFHQECWQAVRSVDVVAPAAALARLQVLPRTGLLRSTPAPAFVLDPVVLDAAGQVIGFWTADRLERGRIVFPFRLAALDIYAAVPAEGETLDCRAAIELVGDGLVRSDIDVLDPAGQPWMRLTGWEDKRFDVPERYGPLIVPSELAPISTPWQEPVAAYAGRPVACRRLDARLPADGGLWKRVWASRVLGRRERELFAALRLPEHRQLEWLGARSAAKEAVAELLRGAHGLELLPADIEILAGEGGAPVVVAPELERLGSAAVVSLAHAQGEAVALAALLGSGSVEAIGIDIEHLATRPPGFAEAALREDERRLIEGVPADLADEWLLRCWCAKEAVGKALGSGMAPGGTQTPAATSLDLDRQEVVVRVGERRLVAHTLRDGDLVVATTLSREGRRS
jgi:acyl transferase domain-containing protein/phosphopantetheinyl transferase (holo-ACP synthase)